MATDVLIKLISRKTKMSWTFKDSVEKLLTVFEKRIPPYYLWNKGNAICTCAFYPLQLLSVESLHRCYGIRKKILMADSTIVAIQ
uniref:Uncharacterized protein n=1 Tax=Megaselia scalaris TaxID=36166 RepID=T1H532_MEGSC